MRMLLMSLAAAAVLSTPAIAGDTTAAPTKAKDPEKIICKVDRTTGSTISNRVCKKRSQWEQERQDAQDLLDDRGFRGVHDDPGRRPTSG